MALNAGGGPLTAQVMPALLARLEADGNRLTPDQVAALRAIPATIEAMAHGKAGSKFLLSDLPMGMGKTTALAETVKAILSDPGYAGVGVLILVNQLKLIKPLIARIGLAHDDARLNVSVGNPPDGVVEPTEKAALRAELKNIGNPVRNAAQVMITTQPMLVLLYRHRPDYFHFQSKWRRVVVWDEAASPAHPISITLPKIREVAGKAFDAGKRTMATALQDWADELERTEASHSTVPGWSAAEGWGEAQKSFEQEWLSAEWALVRMQGQSVHVHRDTQKKIAVVHYFETLPARLAPILILDAYGHDRLFYKLWRDRRGNLTFLPRAPKSYAPLTFHRVSIPAGKKAHRTPEEKAVIVKVGVAAHFEASGPMLNAIHKPVKDSYDVQADIMEGVKAAGGDPYRDSFETWGNLTGVNDYGNHRDMFVGGLYRKPPHHYKAIYSAAARLRGADAHDETTLNDIELSEIMHELQQAVGRVAVRKNVNGAHPEVQVRLAAPINAGRLPLTDDHLRAGFPDCTLKRWHPIPQSLKSGKGSGFKTAERDRLLEHLPLCTWFRVGDFAADGFTDQKVRRYMREEPFWRALEDAGLTLEQRTVNTGKARAHEYRLVPVSSGSCKKRTVQDVEETALLVAA